MAEAALEDNRFGSFGDIIAKCNSALKQGDMLLTVQGLSPEYWDSRDKYRAWHNPRGRGSANRTHDASVNDCELYPVNLIEYDEPRYNIHYRANDKHSILGEFISDASHSNLAAKDDPNAIEMAANDGKVFHLKHRDDATPEKITSHIARHVYVSVEKSDGWYHSEKTPRANFEVYPSEFVNLTVMNSVWLKYAITTQKLSGWRVGGEEVLFSYAIRYLKTALDYVSKREETERALISAIDPDICSDDNWPLALSEWKLETGTHNIAAYQAKRFAKWYRNRHTR